MKRTFFCLCLILAVAWSKDDKATDEAAKKDDADTETKTILRRPPSITAQPNVEYIYRDAEEILLPCKATGEPQPSYEWHKNGEILDVNQGNLHLSPDVTDGSLRIDPATVLDQGYYQCYAFNQHGKSLTRVAFLQKAVLGTYPSADPRRYAVREGESLIVPCEGIPSIPSATFSWALVKDTVDNNPINLQTTRRIQIDKTGNLYFSHVRKTDAQDQKLYKCNVFNAHLDITTGGSYSEIVVEDNPDLGDVTPRLIHSTPGPVIAILGESFSIKCIFAGRPEPKVTWSRVDGVLPAGRNQLVDYETELQVTSVQKEDAGQYKCQAFGQGSSEIQFTQVLVESRPRFTERPISTNATEEEDFSFVCKADAVPAANIHWLINGDPVGASNPGPRITISPDGYTLTVKNLCKDCGENAPRTSDLMVVQCNASNVHGYDFADAYLNVLLPTVIVVKPESIRIENDLIDLEEAHFECIATSDDSTPITYTWYFKDQLINPDDHEDIRIEGHTLIVDLTDKTLEEKNSKHDGTYKCVASNSYSQDTALANLEVPGVAAPVTGSLNDLWWVFLIVAIILLLLILLLCCCLCIQRNKGDTYPVDEKERANGNDPEKELVDSGFHDYQRPEEGPIKGSRASLSSTIKLDSDDEGSLNEYGDIDAGKFTEDGSFIGQYATDKKRRPHDSQV